MKNSKLFLTVFFLCITEIVYTQTFTLVTEDMCSPSPTSNSMPVFTDLDGDGLLDLLAGCYWCGNIRHFEQDAMNPDTFNLVAYAFNSINAGNNSAPAIADLDGDGLLDLLVGQREGNIYHYQQNSVNSTLFTMVTANFNSIDVGKYSAPIFTDIDGDGLLDLLIGEMNGTIYHYEQDLMNSTSFTLVTANFNSIDVYLYSAPTITDLDSDGLLDLLIGEFDGNIHHYEQNSVNSTSFTLVTENFNAIDVGQFAAPTFTDLDGDGFLDLIIGEFDGNLNHWEANTASIDTLCIFTDAASCVSGNSAVLRGAVINDNSHIVTRRGICYSTTNPTPTLNDIQEPNGNGLGIFSDTFLGLSIGTTYYFCAFSTSSLGTYYGAVRSFIAGTSPSVYALDFDGDNDYVKIPDADIFDLTNNYTLEAWIKPESFGWKEGIIGKYYGLTVDGYLLQLRSSSPYNGLVFDGMYTSTGIMVAGQWYHIAAVNDNGTRRIYLNGIEQSLSGTPINVQSNNDPLVIGMNPRSYPKYFDGLIDEVRIWNIALDSNQIRENMYRKLNGNESGLISYWRFYEGSGLITFDFVSLSIGTLKYMTNDDWIQSTVPTPFFTITDGDWENNNTWAVGQNTPTHPWSRVWIKNNNTLNSNMEVIEIVIDTNVILTISTGDTLTDGDQ